MRGYPWLHGLEGVGVEVGAEGPVEFRRLGDVRRRRLRYEVVAR